MVELEQLNIHSSREIIARHGLTLPELFEFSLEFYKEEKHQFNLSYDQKNQLAAYWRQSTLGPYHPDKLNPGYFDFVGNDRKKAWEALGEISANGAMAGFCNLLETVCPDLVPWIRHKKRERENKAIEKKKQEEARKIIAAAEEKEAAKLINIVKRAEEIKKLSTKEESSDDEDDEMPCLEKNDRNINTSAPVPVIPSSNQPSNTSQHNGVHSEKPPTIEPTVCPKLIVPENVQPGGLVGVEVTDENEVTESCAVEENGDEETAVEAAIEHAVTEEAVTEPVVEEAVPDETVAEKAVAEEPDTEQAVAEQAAAEEANKEETITEAVTEPVLEEAVTEPVSEEAVIEPVLEEAVSELVDEEAVTEEEQSIANEATTEEAAIEDATSKEVVTEEVVTKAEAVILEDTSLQTLEKENCQTETGTSETVNEHVPQPVATQSTNSEPSKEDKVVKELVEEVVTEAKTEIAAEASSEVSEGAKLDNASANKNPKAENSDAVAAPAATPDALNAILTQHFACVLYLRQMKEAGHTLTPEQDNYLVQMSVYDEQLKNLRSKLVQASTPDVTTEQKKDVPAAGESEAAPQTSSSATEENVPASDNEVDQETLVVPSRSVTNSQESFSVISTGESLQVISSDEIESCREVEGGVDENAERVISEELRAGTTVQDTASEQTEETTLETPEPVEMAEQQVETALEAEITTETSVAAQQISELEALTDPTPSETAPTQPSEPAPTQPVQPAPTQPSEPVPTQPSETAPTQPAEPAPTQPSEPVPTQLAEPVPTQPSEPVPTQSAEPALTQPSEPAPTQPSELAPTQLSEPAPTQPSEPVPTQAAEPVPTQPSEPALTQAAEPAPIQPSEPVPTQPSQPVPTQPSEPPPTQPSEPTPTQAAEPAPTQSSEPAPTQPSETAPTQPSEHAPTQPSEPVPTQPSEPVPTQPFEPVPTQPSEPAPTQPSKPVPTQLSEPAPTQPSEPALTQRVEPVPIEVAQVNPSPPEPATNSIEPALAGLAPTVLAPVVPTLTKTAAGLVATVPELIQPATEGVSPVDLAGTTLDSAAPDNAQELSALACTLQSGLPEESEVVKPTRDSDDESEGEVRLWSKNGVDLFIAEVSQDADSVLHVGRGETVTVRIPTYESGTALYWEFATQNYDIGFGASFEWEDEGEVTSSPVPVTSPADGSLTVRREPILPILRRSSHEKVITGSHAFPRGGTYLLMFDNSFSLLRSKTVFYRVFYTR